MRVRTSAARSTARGLHRDADSDISTTDIVEFRTIREDILLQAMTILKEVGTGFALPSRTVYNTTDAGLHAERSQAEEEQA